MPFYSDSSSSTVLKPNQSFKFCVPKDRCESYSALSSYVHNQYSNFRMRDSRRMLAYMRDYICYNHQYTLMLAEENNDDVRLLWALKRMYEDYRRLILHWDIVDSRKITALYLTIRYVHAYYKRMYVVGLPDLPKSFKDSFVEVMRKRQIRYGELKNE